MGSYIDGNCGVCLSAVVSFPVWGLIVLLSVPTYHTYAYLFVPIRTCLIGGPTGSHQPHHLRKGIDDGLKMEVEFGVNY